ncbi:37S ribosomal protein, mitochondrial [Pleurotus pulmonarius]|nr:37S ribosomal protein, mitochondrial [Pleurotus pulmonarius]KAF4603907.1 37S ribosomal protein, mitochondrial [Pleurotus pulmonarius]KAF4608733.1 37S ribosomal protein, mitochondrial [Pleurotus pulmonarius]
MSLPALRSWFAPARCCARNLRVFAARHASTDASLPDRLETPEEWTEFQLQRAEFKMLADAFEPYGSVQSPEDTWKPSHGLHKPPAEGTVSALLASGAHLGHSRSLMNPNFMPYAYGVRAGVTVIDLDQTLPLLRRAAKLVRAIAYAGGQVVFIGTRPDLRPVVQKAAQRLGGQGFYVGERWLPGTLTNKMQLYGADVVKDQKVTPDLVVLLNPLANMNAIRECAIEHVPTIGVIDSNADPRIVMYPIPANDESTRAAELIAGVLSIAGREGAGLRRAEAEREQEHTRDRRSRQSKQQYNTFDY